MLGVRQRESAKILPSRETKGKKKKENKGKQRKKKKKKDGVASFYKAEGERRGCCPPAGLLPC